MKTYNLKYGGGGDDGLSLTSKYNGDNIVVGNGDSMVVGFAIVPLMSTLVSIFIQPKVLSNKI